MNFVSSTLFTFRIGNGKISYNLGKTLCCCKIHSLLIKMSNKYLLYGWRVSYYTAKVRCYLKYKNIPFEEKLMNLYDLNFQVNKKVNAKVMPVLLSPDGEWIQDSNYIINCLENLHPSPSVYPGIYHCIDSSNVNFMCSYTSQTYC